MKIKAVLFDLDGVLVDAKEWHYVALNKALEKHDCDPISRQDHLTSFDGLPTRVKLRMLSKVKQVPEGLHDQIYETKQQLTAELIERNSTKNKENIEAVQYLKDQGYNLACCSNAIRSSVERMLQSVGLYDFFDYILSNEDVGQPKPNPEMYIKAIEYFGLLPGECLVVEDNHKGFRSAINAGAKLMKVQGTADVTKESLIQEIKFNENLVNVVIPMAGEGNRFRKEGYTTPKPFIDVDGKPMIQRVIDGLTIPNRRIIFIVRDEQYDEYIEYLDRVRDNNSIVITASKTEGAACTVLHALSLIDTDEPLLILNSDQFVFTDITGLVNRDESCILTFFDNSGSKKWSYAKVVDDMVVSVREKVPISDYATVGFYFFKKGYYFVDGAVEMIVENDRHNNEFYVCPIYNYLIRKGLPVSHMLIRNDQWASVGTPELLKKYLREKQVVEQYA